MSETNQKAEIPEGWSCEGDRATGPRSEEAASFDGRGIHVGREDDMGMGWCGVSLPLPVLRALLSAHGLTIVGDADKRVLDAMWAIPDGTLALALRGLSADNWVSLPDSIRNGLLAEKLRRTP